MKKAKHLWQALLFSVAAISVLCFGKETVATAKHTHIYSESRVVG